MNAFVRLDWEEMRGKRNENLNTLEQKLLRYSNFEGGIIKLVNKFLGKLDNDVELVWDEEDEEVAEEDEEEDLSEDEDY